MHHQVLERVVAQVAYRGELVLICGDGSPYGSPTALNTVLQFWALRLRHTLFVSDSAARQPPRRALGRLCRRPTSPPLPFFSCARLRRTVPQLACVWSSSIGALQLHVRSQAISPRFRCPSHVTAPSRPNNQGLCNRKHWDLRFYFYHVRKALVARLAAAVRCWALALVSSSGLSGPARAAIVREVHLLDPKSRARAAKGGGAWHLAPSQLCAHRRLTTA